MSEVRYQMLRPAQIVARRKERPVVYIPLGTLEWHGEHNPLGADALQAEGLAILCAQKGGGLVFPPLYYGESRLESLMEAVAEDRAKIAEKMELPSENFEPDKHPFTATEQAQNYHKLLIHILAEAESLGFELGVFVCGHYPLIDYARAAVLHFNKRRYSRYHGMLSWRCLIIRWSRKNTIVLGTTPRVGRRHICWPLSRGLLTLALCRQRGRIWLVWAGRWRRRMPAPSLGRKR